MLLSVEFPGHFFGFHGRLSGRGTFRLSLRTGRTPPNLGMIDRRFGRGRCRTQRAAAIGRYGNCVRTTLGCAMGRFRPFTFILSLNDRLALHLPRPRQGILTTLLFQLAVNASPAVGRLLAISGRQTTVGTGGVKELTRRICKSFTAFGHGRGRWPTGPGSSANPILLLGVSVRLSVRLLPCLSLPVIL